MADGRMLKKAISMSRRLADLKTNEARLIYTWLIPHLDVEGRFSGDPDVIKGSVVPRICSITPEIIESSISDMHELGLLEWYESDGDKFIQLRKFKEHQHLRPDRERPSEIPPPTGHCPDSAGTQPAPREDKIREVNIKHTSDRATKMPYSDMFDSCYKIYPRREGRKRAHKAFIARIREGVDPNLLLEATKRYREKCKGVVLKYIKLPATFFGPDEHWKEMIEGDIENESLYSCVCANPQCGNEFKDSDITAKYCYGCRDKMEIDNIPENNPLSTAIGKLARGMSIENMES